MLALAIAVPELCSGARTPASFPIARSGDTVSVVIAEGKHPVPSRTRKLSPPAPMVLPGQLGGRVGRRRTPSRRAALRGRLFSSGLGAARYALGMPKAMRPRPGPKARPKARRPGLPRDVVSELRHMSPDRQGRHGDRPAGTRRRAARPGRRAAERPPRPQRPRSSRRGPRRPRGPGARAVPARAVPEALSEMQAYRRMSGRADQNHIIADCLRVARPARPGGAPRGGGARVQGVPLAAKAEAVIVAASALADQGKFDQALGMLRRIRTRDDVAGPEVIRVWYVTGTSSSRPAGAPTRCASSARSCATTRARSTRPSAPLSSPDQRRRLALAALPPVADRSPSRSCGCSTASPSRCRSSRRRRPPRVLRGGLLPQHAGDPVDVVGLRREPRATASVHVRNRSAARSQIRSDLLDRAEVREQERRSRAARGSARSRRARARGRSRAAARPDDSTSPRQVDAERVAGEDGSGRGVRERHVMLGVAGRGQDLEVPPAELDDVAVGERADPRGPHRVRRARTTSPSGPRRRSRPCSRPAAWDRRGAARRVRAPRRRAREAFGERPHLRRGRDGCA